MLSVNSYHLYTVPIPLHTHTHLFVRSTFFFFIMSSSQRRRRRPALVFLNTHTHIMRIKIQGTKGHIPTCIYIKENLFANNTDNSNTLLSIYIQYLNPRGKRKITCDEIALDFPFRYVLLIFLHAWRFFLSAQKFGNIQDGDDACASK